MSDPQSTKQVDVAVLGAGPGGYVAAIRLAQLGSKVLCVDRDRLGGVCLNYGCIPSKSLIHASSLVESIQGAGAMGVEVEGVTVDMAKMKAWKDGVVQRLTGGIGHLFRANGVETLIGEASFEDAHTLRVHGAEGTVTVKAGAVLVATGARAAVLPGLEPDGERLLTSKEALDLTEVPERLLVVGGGIVGCEIGTYLAKLGSRVTIVELADTLLAGTDPDLVKVVLRGMKKRKMKVHTSTKVSHVEHGADGMQCTLAGPRGETKVEADRILVAVGFRPNTEELNLAAAGVKTDERGHIRVDEKLRTSHPDVYAIGDVIGPPYLAHKASKEGLVAAEIIAGADVVLDVRAMPAAIFTDPEIATVGLTEAVARDQGRDVKVGSFPFAANGRALSTGHPEGMVKLVSDAADDTLLGVHIVGREASDLISEAVLAIEMGASAADLALTVHPHPTLSEALMEAAHIVGGHAVHVHVPTA